MAQYFTSLNYTLGDEDATPEMLLLPEQCTHVMAVADCGSRVIPLLARFPQRLTCVDISAPQLAVCELRIALLKACDLACFKGFLGYDDSISASDRREIFQALPLSQHARTQLEAMFNGIEWGSILYLGQFERMLQKIAKVTCVLTGEAGAGIFKANTLEEQQSYYRNKFPHWRWKLVLLLLGNSTALNSLLYKGDFPKKNRAQSHFAIYQEIFEKLLTEQPAVNSFFLQMVFFGRILYREGYPIECNAEVFSKAKAAVQACEINYVEGDVFEAAAIGNRGIGFLSLSDVPSFLQPSEEENFLQKIRPGLLEQALVVVRAHLRRPAPILDGFIDITEAHPLMASSELTRLWSFHLYRKI